jgi:type I restriction enzyme S subunit
MLKNNDLLPLGWERRNLNEVSEIILGQSPPSSSYNCEGVGLPFFQGKTEFGPLYPKAVKWCSNPKKIAQNNDILISVRAPVGPTNMAQMNCCIGRGLAAIRPKGDILSKYILYFLRSISSEIESFGTGTTFKAISGEVLRSLPIPIAPPNIRKNIVAEIEKQFSRLDEAVAGLKRAKANLKRYKAAILKSAVEGRITEQWRKDHPDVEPAEKLLQRILAERRAKWEQAELAKMNAKNQEHNDSKWKQKYKEPIGPDQTNLTSLPNGWTWCTSDQIFWFVTSGSRGWAKYYSNEGPVFLRIGNLDHNSIELDLKNIQHVQPPKGAEEVRTQVEANDLLISITADVGMVAVIPQKFEEAYINQHIALSRPGHLVDSFYLGYFLTSKSGQNQFQKFQRGATKVGLGLDDIKGVNIALPPLKEQKEIVLLINQRLSIIGEIEKSIDLDLRRSERLRQSILKKAFSGQLIETKEGSDLSGAALA